MKKTPFIKTGKCIWCGKTEPEVTFYKKPHIVPDSLGGENLGCDICDDCNHFFGTATPGVPSIDFAFKEVFGAFRMFGKNLDENSYKKYQSALFEYRHSKRLIRIKQTINIPLFTEAFKRGLYEVFLQEYHRQTGNGNHPMFDFIREYARYGKGKPHVFYAFNNVILGSDQKDNPFLTISEHSIEEMKNSGLFRFWFMDHIFYLEVFPTAYNANGNQFLRNEAKSVLLPALGNECIFEFKDVRQVDFLMRRFNS